MLKREKESAKKDKEVRRERPTSDVHTEDKKEHTAENSSNTSDVKMP